VQVWLGNTRETSQHSCCCFVISAGEFPPRLTGGTLHACGGGAKSRAASDQDTQACSAIGELHKHTLLDHPASLLGMLAWNRGPRLGAYGSWAVRASVYARLRPYARFHLAALLLIVTPADQALLCCACLLTGGGPAAPHRAAQRLSLQPDLHQADRAAAGAGGLGQWQGRRRFAGRLGQAQSAGGEGLEYDPGKWQRKSKMLLNQNRALVGSLTNLSVDQRVLRDAYSNKLTRRTRWLTVPADGAAVSRFCCC
jgi:hypothetical protein